MPEIAGPPQVLVRFCTITVEGGPARPLTKEKYARTCFSVGHGQARSLFSPSGLVSTHVSQNVSKRRRLRGLGLPRERLYLVIVRMCR